MQRPRFFVDLPLVSGARFALPTEAARHVQVRRLQPGDEITLFNGQGGQWQARVAAMHRRDVEVTVDAHEAFEREAAQRIHLAVGIFSVDRMDWLVEKATELGAASLTPVVMARSNVATARIEKRLPRWRAINISASEQCGRNRLMTIHPPASWAQFLQALPDGRRWLLAPQGGDARALPFAAPTTGVSAITLLSGPEGGLTSAETNAALAHGFSAVSLGPRILRAETAPLALLGLLAWPAAPADNSGSSPHNKSHS